MAAVCLLTTKRALRKRVGGSVAAMPAEELRNQSLKVAERVVGCSKFRDARAVAVFLSMPNGELSTECLLANIFAQSKKCFVPRVEGVRSMSMYQCFGEADILSFERSKWQIPEPPADDGKREKALACDELDLIIVPGVAFDFANNRIGHGRGYYDTYFSALQQARSQRGLAMPYLLGVALAPQMVDSVPVEGTDWVLNQVAHQ